MTLYFKPKTVIRGCIKIIYLRSISNTIISITYWQICKRCALCQGSRLEKMPTETKKQHNKPLQN